MLARPSDGWLVGLSHDPVGKAPSLPGSEREEGCGISVRPCNDDDLMGITRSVNHLTNEALS